MHLTFVSVIIEKERMDISLKKCVLQGERETGAMGLTRPRFFSMPTNHSLHSLLLKTHIPHKRDPQVQANCFTGPQTRKQPCAPIMEKQYARL